MKAYIILIISFVLIINGNAENAVICDSTQDLVPGANTLEIFLSAENSPDLSADVEILRSTESLYKSEVKTSEISGKTTETGSDQHEAGIEASTKAGSGKNEKEQITGQAPICCGKGLEEPANKTLSSKEFVKDNQNETGSTLKNNSVSTISKITESPVTQKEITQASFYEQIPFTVLGPYKKNVRVGPSCISKAVYNIYVHGAAGAYTIPVEICSSGSCRIEYIGVVVNEPEKPAIQQHNTTTEQQQNTVREGIGGSNFIFYSLAAFLIIALLVYFYKKKK